MNENVPAHKTMILFFTTSQGIRLRGQPRRTNITTIYGEVQRCKPCSPRASRATALLSNMDDVIHETDVKAGDRDGWQQISRKKRVPA